MRCDKPPFDNNDLRLALKYAIDREEMLKKALGGHGKIGNDQPIPAFDPYFAADIPQRPYDPDKAKFHLKKSGYSGPVSLTIAEGTFTGAMDAAQIYQESATKAGIDFKIDRVPNDGYWDDVWMKAGFCGSYWGGRPTPDLMFSVAYASDAPWNETFWKRPDFDKLLLAARGELDETKRKQMYHDLQAMVVDDCGEIIPMFNNFIEAGSSDLAGYVSMPVNEFGGFRAAERVWFKS
jgi:peptide/nickel transport system substrate-binding protein